MYKRLIATIFSFLILLPLIIFTPIAFGQIAPSTFFYTVSGYVFDDLNANGFKDLNEPGIRDAFIYADRTDSYFYTSSDPYGYFTLNVPLGTHSIEIASAGSGGSRPTTAEKVIVTNTNNNILFGIQKGGYAVEGCVKDQFNNAVVGARVYVDFPNRTTTITNSLGCYRIEEVGYDASASVYGVSGGHNIYVEGYNINPVLVNPQSPTLGIRADFMVNNTDSIGPNCGPAYARDPNNPSNCTSFPNRCALPSGWQEVGSCNTNPNPGQPGYTNPYCTVSASPQTGTTPFNSTITGSFNNGSNPNLVPNYYAFTVNGQGHETSTTNSSYSFAWPFNTSGNYPINLSLRYNGGTVNCQTNVTAYAPSVMQDSTYPLSSSDYQAPSNPQSFGDFNYLMSQQIVPVNNTQPAPAAYNPADYSVPVYIPTNYQAPAVAQDQYVYPTYDPYSYTYTYPQDSYYQTTYSDPYQYQTYGVMPSYDSANYSVPVYNGYDYGYSY